MTTDTIRTALKAEERLAANLEQYAGEWVAIQDHNVVRHAGTLRGLLDAAGPEEISSFDRILEVSTTSGVGCFF
jgi:hypothetical protein